MSAFSGAVSLEDAGRLSMDAELLASRRRGTTFWRSLEDAPQCGLEGVAVSVAAFHVEQLSLRGIVGVEWWVQCRDCDGCDGAGSILLHYDKDEVAYEKLGVMRCPTLSTATYLRADAGAAPLVVYDPQFAAVATPVVGKHVAFDGAQLHGVPAELGPLFSGASQNGAGGKRVSLLVNLWTSEPVGADALDATAAGDLGLSSAEPRSGGAQNAARLVRSPAAFDDGRGARRFCLSDDAHGAATPPLPLASRGDPQRARRHRDAARDGLLVFRFA